jgi:tetratricopeptide (TPR) repeat protein
VLRPPGSCCRSSLLCSCQVWLAFARGATMSKTRKEAGSAFFKEGKYEQALECYRDALRFGGEADSSSPADRIALRCNESLACLKLGRHHEACEAALQACELDVTRVKSLFRLASALLDSGLARSSAEVADVGIGLARCAHTMPTAYVGREHVTIVFSAQLSPRPLVSQAARSGHSGV